ncbi:glycoside hydrolase family 97 protein [Pseudoduganella namucuonensis]|uniref:Glycosyl-hydrolase 97 C-terminal, oligomerisation n=1 Tax=Pseudoduganella namucuonensis TaxID=1035707 RepID=A0A1I7JEI8_9BURK|nr:glycoside hydrolase family 97 protein [Pseudoduganella namucuonensis]SFU83596.1 Glycosyl-hydrolase 97 C-terminal, oligomerisation [Pseudoduganella namucuonensis]
MTLHRTLYPVLALATAALGAATPYSYAAPLSSPDQRLAVTFAIDAGGLPVYSVALDSKPVLLKSSLGLKLDGADFTRGLSLASSSQPAAISDRYELNTGKRRVNIYKANEQVYTLRNARKQKMDVVFRVSNDGVAFRYVVAEPSLPLKKFVSEETSFAFAKSALAWLQPMSNELTGWMNTNPSYEEHYKMGVAVGTPSPLKAGWVFPALFKTDAAWVALTEAGIDGSFHASRLQAQSPDGVYRIGGPAKTEVFTGGGLLAQTRGTLTSPWRVLAIGSLPTVTDSTLGTDLAAPAVKTPVSLAQPGHASWSWAIMKDDATVYDVQKRFIDYAADMKWDYTLIDADWDRKIGYDKIKELTAYAATKNVGVLVWYNSSGAWNQTEYSPKGKLLTREARRAEFARMQAMGVKGVKVDFFGGDGQSMIAYYIDILNDAADHGLLVNFHGATLPRGWSRTYPNLMTAEAIRGFEFTTFEQRDQDAVVKHVSMLPFTRNLFDPMDFTPMVFGDIPKIKRATRNGFELAESVLMVSGIQHFAEIPEGMATVPAYVKSYLQDLPRSWDDSKLVDGFPGKFAVIARKAGDSWYVAGVNSEESDKALELDLSFIGDRQGVLMTDGAGEREFAQSAIQAGKGVKVSIKPRGGFVAVFK